jgi:hypothetical protein
MRWERTNEEIGSTKDDGRCFSTEYPKQVNLPEKSLKNRKIMPVGLFLLSGCLLGGFLGGLLRGLLCCCHLDSTSYRKGL